MTNINSIAEEAEERFGHATGAETRLFNVLWGSGRQDEDVESPQDPAAGDNTVRADRLRWLLVESGFQHCLKRVGFRLVGTEVVGPLRLDDVDADFEIAFENCLFRDLISLERGKLRQLDLTNSTFHKGFRASGIRIEGDCILFGVTAASDVTTFDDARIGGTFFARAAAFSVPGDCALSLARAKVDGSCFLDGVTVDGQARLTDCRVGAVLDCSGAKVLNPGKHSLDLDRSRIAGSCFLGRGFESQGRVSLQHAQIHGYFVGTGARMTEPELVGRGEDAEPYSLDAGYARIGGDCLLAGMHCEGTVGIRGAGIGGDLVCIGGDFAGRQNSFFAVQAEVKGRFELCGDAFDGIVNFSLGQCGALTLRESDGVRLGDRKPKAYLDLRHAQCNVLEDDGIAWACFGSYDLEGFSYDAIWSSALNGKERAKWLGGSLGSVSLHAYEQLARVLRAAGHVSDSRTVLVAKENSRSVQWKGFLGIFCRPVHRLYGLLTGYGHRPWRALIGLFALWAIGLIVVFVAGNAAFFRAKDRIYVEQAQTKATQPPKGSPTFQMPLAYPPLEPWAYSLDTLVPFLDMHQEEYWLPDRSKTVGDFVQWYFWSHTLLGWLLATFGVAAISGLVKRE